MLQKIKEMSCPYCGCDRIDSESRYSQHYTGQWNEERKFQCGLTLEYSPNYERVSETKLCERSAEANRIRNAKDSLVEDIVKLIKAADVPKDYKKSFISDLRWKKGRTQIWDHNKEE